MNNPTETMCEAIERGEFDIHQDTILKASKIAFRAGSSPDELVIEATIIAKRDYDLTIKLKEGESFSLVIPMIIQRT